MESAAAENRAADATGAAGQKRRKGLAEERGKRVASCGQKARSLQRLLEHKKDLPEEVRAQFKETAEALQKQHRKRVKELKRQKFIRAKKALYSKLKFYELKKVQRRLQQTRKELVALLSKQQQQIAAAAGSQKKKKQETPGHEAGEDSLAERIAESQNRLRLQLDDLNYIRLYPVDEPYVALFPAQDSEESQKKRNAMRLRIRELLLNSRMSEDANENEEAGGDDMFVDAGDDQQGTSAPGDPFEEAHALSDEEAETQQSRERPRFGQKPQGRPQNNNRGPPHASHHKAVPPGQARGQSSSGYNQRNKYGTTKNAPSEKHKQERDKQKRDRSQRDHKQTHQEKQQRTEGVASAETQTAANQQPMRIGLSKHKTANQHLIFESDDD